MAIESDNTKGNRFHDEKDGKFTSKTGGSGSSPTKVEEKREQPILNNKIQLKPGMNLADLMTNINKTSNPLKYGLNEPKTIKEAEEQGNKIIGSTNSAVGYDKTTDIRVAHQYNEALRDVTLDFEKIMFGSDKLFVYGTKSKMNYDEKISSQIDSLLNSGIYNDKLKALNVTANELSDISKFIKMSTESWLSGYNKGDFNVDTGGATAFLNPANNNVKGLDALKLKILSIQDKTISIGSSIKFNIAHSKNMDNWDIYMRNGVSNHNFLPIGDKNGAYYVATHELGHHVFEQLTQFMNNSERKELGKLVNLNKQELFFLALNEDISGYATTNVHEHVAEAFGNYYTMRDKATEHNKQIMNVLFKAYKRIYGR